MPDPEDVHADITGDPPAPPPMSQKQVAGAQKAQVNRTQLPSGGPHPAGKGMSPGDGKPDGAMPPDKVPPVTPDTPVLGGAEALINAGEQGSMGAADQQLQYDPRNFNPWNGMDWLKEAASSPLSTYHLGRRVYDTYFGAFIDPGAISYSIQNIQAQDDALTVAGKNNAGRGRMGGAATQQAAQQQKQDAQARLTGGEQQIKGAADTAATALTIGANPWNMLPFGQARGAAMLAMM
ncbi:MAG TPA: hypothetical protein VFD88_10710, partial [Clostridia bacterium]|nr:hypothetical protein [Clostridia bacterium]